MREQCEGCGVAMKLGPRQVRFMSPFWPTLFGRTVRFTGRRNTVHLQETAHRRGRGVTALPVLRPGTVFRPGAECLEHGDRPLLRIVAVRYRRKIILRLVILALLAALLARILQLPRTNPWEWTWLDAAADGILLVPIVTLGCIVWWRIPPSYTFRFRLKDGKRRKFHFAIRSKIAKRQFDDALTQYRQAARAYAPAEGTR